MKHKGCYLLIFFIGIKVFGQVQDSIYKRPFFIVPEILVGKTGEANTGFPETKLQKSFFISLGRHNKMYDQQWAILLGYPKTGISLGVTNFGNTEKLGMAYTLMPFIEVGIFSKYSNRWNLNIGMGSSYIDKQFNPDTNPFNHAVTTKINWAFRSFVYYDLLKGETINWRLGFGYTHYSNGHTRLPNQGLNSFLISLSSSIGKEDQTPDSYQVIQEDYRIRTSETYFSGRIGIGQNVLSRIYNDKKEVYSVALSAGKIINRTFKFGAGFYYRFYEQYYDHIKENGELISEQVPNFRENPYHYATNLGVFVSTELLMGHLGVEIDLGVNIYKPFYKIDWQLSQGYFFNGEYVRFGELDSYYQIKRTISSKLGIKYYLFNTSKSPKSNIFLGASINANLGQADFSDLSLGYVYRFNIREKKKIRSN